MLFAALPEGWGYWGGAAAAVLGLLALYFPSLRPALPVLIGKSKDEPAAETHTHTEGIVCGVCGQRAEKVQEVRAMYRDAGDTETVKAMDAGLPKIVFPDPTE